ncbi:MAG: hypothetical protein EAZ65_04750 [Verrucomicrobia bacterium]|nr:MAG: hypothetical protein EAZ84_13705 [Verrucomicrobiota bacterium]TAE88047.1 MAG: hypothetical protein EAZ82_06005 [Verrucomicrobiota bacterium]TAF22899.1 MAG: hypothetical protein EAZ71_13630 [Verrucomicrobiota bacterium]TAF41826.1 MAG: hypothetical protein EAZ65_04750 [Verrucomicrobiota bacterium]
MKNRLAAAVLPLLLFASCAPSTPATRIAAQPAAFAQLPTHQQELVRQGRIDKGMSPAAVLLAWGRPSREYEGHEAGSTTLRWDYTGTAPVYHAPYPGYYGYGYAYSRFGSYRRAPYLDVGIGPEISYLPYRRASVLFREGRVSEWEQIR